jgi:hypothetical protein
MGYPDNFNAYLYDTTIGSSDEHDAPPKVDEVKLWAAKQIGNSLAMWRNSFLANFPGCKWDASEINDDVLREFLEGAAFDATKKGY